MKQRLVGAIVLGSLAVIFIPVLLDGKGLSSPEISAIPAPPPRPPVPDLRPERPVILADTPAITVAPPPEPVPLPLEPIPEAVDEAAANAPVEAPPPVIQETEPAAEAPRLDERGIPAAWNVRLASFADRANAEALVVRLQSNGYKGYSRPIDSSQGPLTAVYVGPVLTRAEADGLRRTLQGEFGLEGLVVRFETEEPGR